MMSQEVSLGCDGEGRLIALSHANRNVVPVSETFF